MIYGTGKMSFLILISTALLVNLPMGDGVRVLGLFPHPGLSHFHFFQPIMRGLAEAGHNVTVVSHFPDSKPHTNYKDLPLTGADLLINTVDLAVSEIIIIIIIREY